MPTKPAATTEDLVKTYVTRSAEVPALRGVTLTIEPAALTAVVGPSGSGKTSLLRLLAGMDHPTSGRIWVGGLGLHGASGRTLRHLRRRTVGYVFQRPAHNFVPYLTVGEHLALAARRVPPGRARGPARILSDLGLADRIDHVPQQLSGGEQQRAAFAQALAGGASLILADEPTAELDDRSAADLLRAAMGVVEDGVAVLMATHSEAVRSMADRVIDLEHGLIRRRIPGGAALMSEHASRWAGQEPWRPPEPERSPARLSGPPLAVAQGIRKSFRRGGEIVHAVRDADLSLHEGELVALIGRSGSGKTTLLSILAGWERPDEGRVAWGDGAPIVPETTWRDIAVVPQTLGLIEDFTAWENVTYPLRLAGGSDEGPAEDLIADLGLEGVTDRYPRETSVGEQQRTALARAIVTAPRILVADEPTGHQDHASRAAVFEALRRAAERGTSCLIATHDEAARSVSDRVYAMSDGRVREEAPGRREHRGWYDSP